ELVTLSGAHTIGQAR
nr:RecName: Full=Peroxidase 8 [Cycas revoluta]